MNLLTDLNRNSGITILMVTHEPDMAGYARTIVHFRDGLVESVEQKGSPDRHPGDGRDPRPESHGVSPPDPGLRRGDG
jgi:energy-coupling factor transporter ATP-binding protein EcfA2